MYKIELFGQQSSSTEQNLLTTAVERYTGYLPTVMAFHLSQKTLDVMKEDSRSTSPDVVVHLSSVEGSLEQTIDYCAEKSAPLFIASYPHDIDHVELARKVPTITAVFEREIYDAEPSHQNLAECADDARDILNISLNLADLFMNRNKSGVIRASALRSLTSANDERIRQRRIPQKITEPCFCGMREHSTGFTLEDTASE